LIHTSCFISHIFSNSANGLDELSGDDNMKMKEVQVNSVLAVATTSNKGKRNSATRLVDAPFILQQYEICD
jgi:hypothetical protein